MVDYDSPWKNTLARFFPEFMQFFFPRAHRGIDWARGYVFLDKELQRSVRDSTLGRRYVDKLVQVHRKGGGEDWLLIHVEVQGQSEQAFAERLFTYHYRLFDRYHRAVVTQVVLADTSADFHPREFRYSNWGCELRLRFPTVKLLELATRQQRLERSRNPFALVVAAHLAAQRTAHDPGQRFDSKLGLLRRLYARGWERQAILELLRFIDWVLELPTALEGQFWNEVRQLEEKPMGRYITSLERMAIRRGMEQGRLEGQSELIYRLLQHRFGPLPDWVLPRLSEASAEKLLHWGERLVEASSLEEVFQ